MSMFHCTHHDRAEDSDYVGVELVDGKEVCAEAHAELTATPILTAAEERDAWAAVARNLGQILVGLSSDDRLDADTQAALSRSFDAQTAAHGLTVEGQ